MRIFLARVIAFISTAWLTCAVFAGEGRGQTPNEQATFFEQKVRPILVERCLSCHGPKKPKAGLRLDSREAVLHGSKENVVVISGKPEQSPLIQAIRYQGDLKMPPTGKLPDAEIAILQRWVALGLPWPKKVVLAAPQSLAEQGAKHWAFQPIVKPAIPSVHHGKWVRSPVDAFLLAKLEASGLEPSPAADRRTLIRRASFDLLGLPPTPAEVDSFEADPDPNAYEKLLDRLLASAHYGERWARHWLDVVRYADDKGYVFFEDKSYPWAFTYRDYVIGALNHDLPYDRFLLEQLAADQISLDDPKSLAALGFLTVGGHFMNNTHDIIDDRIDVVTRGLMGLTVTCARCHDHKFDPIPQADYYSLYGVFRSCQEPFVPSVLGTPPQTEKYRKYDAELRAHERKLVDFVTAKHHELVTGARSRAGDYLLAAHAVRNQPRADDFMLIADKGDLNPTMITRWRVYLDDTRSRGDTVWIPWHRLAALKDTELAEQSVPLLRSMKDDARINKLVREALPSKISSMKELATVYGRLFAQVAATPTPLATQDAEALRAVLYGPTSPADAPLALDWGFLSLFPDRATQDEYKKLLQALEAFSRKGPARAMVLLDSPRPHDPRIFERGQPNRLGEFVPRQFLRLFNPERKSFQHGSGRLELAKEIISPKNPLTARVLVNRVWMHHFGAPLVGTPSDFGLRSEPPTHPELLDWLAADFVEHGWSIKRLHRMLMTSSVYRQSSLDREDALALDPENRWYWRMNRRRVEFEALHDSLLAVSDSLDLLMGGPSVPLFGTKRKRAVYAHVDRLEFPSLLSTFDVPNPASSTPRRIATTVPPQTLFLMNGPFVRDAARRLLQSQSIQACSDPVARIDRLFRTILNRKPEENERRWALALLADRSADRWLDLVHGLLMTNEFMFID